MEKASDEFSPEDIREGEGDLVCSGISERFQGRKMVDARLLLLLSVNGDGSRGGWGSCGGDCCALPGQERRDMGVLVVRMLSLLGQGDRRET